MSTLRPEDQPDSRPNIGPSASGIPLREEWLGLARSLAYGEDASVFRIAEPGSPQGQIERFWTAERRLLAEQELGRMPGPADWSALNAAIRSIALLAELPRQGAPHELEGRVVASLHAGHRQTRAADFVASLPTLRAPAALDHLVGEVVASHTSGPEASEIPPAPLELDARVADVVAEPEASLVRGMARRLDPMDAPAELDQRVDQTLGEAVRPAPRGPKLAVLSGIAVAAAAALLLVLRPLVGPGSTSGADDTRFRGP